MVADERVVSAFKKDELGTRNTGCICGGGAQKAIGLLDGSKRHGREALIKRNNCKM